MLLAHRGAQILVTILVTMLNLVSILSLTRNGLRLSSRSTSRTSWRLSSSVRVSIDPELASELHPKPPQWITDKDFNEDEGLVLRRCRKDGALEVAWGGASKVRESPFRIDFTSATHQRRMKECRSELVVKAVGHKQTQLLLDFTAGLGRDATLCAAAGLHVVMFERNWVVYQLLQDALRRLGDVKGDDNDDIAALAGRIRLHYADVVAAPEEEIRSVVAAMAATMATDSNNDNDLSVSVYLDPMYPAKAIGRRSAVKKSTQMLHRLVGPSSSSSSSLTEDGKDRYEDADEEDGEQALLLRAVALATNRVVVKRPLRSASIGSKNVAKSSSGGGGGGSMMVCPSADRKVLGSTHRFDIYVPNPPRR